MRRVKKARVDKGSTVGRKAVEKALDRDAAAAALKKMSRKAIWKEEHHPELRSPNDFSRYRRLKSRLTG
jgi:hypothetical protein